jgi:hypothetical protein
MRQITSLGLVILIISLIACGQTSQKTTVIHIPNGWKTFSETGYSIQYPDSFDLDTSGQMGTSFILLSKLSSPQDLFRENINLVIQDLSGQNIDLDKFVEISEKEIQTMITNGNILESKRINIDSSECQEVVFTGIQGQFNLKFEQY